ncbi:related to RMS1-regulatory protein [Phialocephala subalpina]|uniref:Related to RMS1-regulatory protein n=1 Tax=Phialocephala subalpina TaxID=576137 RepID=A0A1L7X1L2_9HELO|nr:related to RMS1-regulatory protein [Phialocephala subalpina]
MEADNFQTTTEVFLSWLAKMGIQISPKIAVADLRTSGKNRGVVAITDIEEDEVLFTIPRSAALNMNTALSDSQLSFLQKTIPDVPGWLALTTIMLVEALRKDSKWMPYFAVLPELLDSLVFWADDELSELQASMVTTKIGKATAEDLFAQHITPLNIENANPTMCHKVASVIMAYAFDIPELVDKENAEGQDEEADELVSDNGEDEKTILSMIPLADMLNADADRNNSRLCCDNEDLEMRAIRPITKGDEIFNDYGQLPRSDLLRRYGYVTDNYAPFDVAELSTESIMSLFRSDESLQLPGQKVLEPLGLSEVNKRIELSQREGKPTFSEEISSFPLGTESLKSSDAPGTFYSPLGSAWNRNTDTKNLGIGIYEDSYDLAHPGPDGPSIPDELLALLYILLLDDEHFAAIQTSETALPSRSRLSTELVGQVLVKLLQLREQEYATTAEEDEALLQAGNLPHRKAMAVQVRFGEKQVLRQAIQEATTFAASNKRMRGQAKVREAVAGGTKRKVHQTEGEKKKVRKR